MPVSHRKDSRYRWARAALQVLFDHIDDDEHPLAVSVITGDQDGLLLLYQLSPAGTGQVVRRIITDPAALAGIMDDASVDASADHVV